MIEGVNVGSDVGIIVGFCEGVRVGDDVNVTDGEEVGLKVLG